MLTISVVSHGHAALLRGCLEDLAAFPEVRRVVLTLNIPEPELDIPAKLADRLVVVENAVPRGFGENHNAAFTQCETSYFCVLNPDVRCPSNPFPILIRELANQNVALVAPAVLAKNGRMEDSIRHFPHPLNLFFKALGWSDGRYSYELAAPPFPADWVAGMFMLFRAKDYRRIGGFDEKFFLYYEDVDICARLWKIGKRVLACPKAQVIHDARRASRHDFQHMGWHAGSLLRYLHKHWFSMSKIRNTNREEPRC